MLTGTDFVVLTENEVETLLRALPCSYDPGPQGRSKSAAELRLEIRRRYIELLDNLRRFSQRNADDD